MNLKKLCEGVKPYCLQIKSQKDFIKKLFDAAGSDGDYISDSYKKLLYNGGKPFAENQKAPMRGKDNLSSLTDFFETSINDENAYNVISFFGIPEKEELNKTALCIALAKQVKLLIDSDEENVDDIIVLEYQNAKSSSDKPKMESFMQPLYPGDSVYVSFKPNQKYEILSYDVIEHQWVLQNTGTQTWQKRKLVYVRDKKTRPEANPNVIEIPVTKPGQFQKLTTKIDGRGFDGIFDCVWEMRDEEDCNCFPNLKNMFLVTIDTKFKRA